MKPVSGMPYLSLARPNMRLNQLASYCSKQKFLDLLGPNRHHGNAGITVARMTAKAATKGAVLTAKAASAPRFGRRGGQIRVIPAAKAANAASPESEKGAQLR